LDILEAKDLEPKSYVDEAELKLKAIQYIRNDN
jgi:hypothetical protein